MHRAHIFNLHWSIRVRGGLMYGLGSVLKDQSMHCREAGGKAEDDAELFPVGSRADPMDWSSSKQQPEWVGPTAADWQAPVAAADEAPAAPRTPPPDVLPDPPPAAAKPPLPRSIP